jgi:hypothetical protein
MLPDPTDPLSRVGGRAATITGRSRMSERRMEGAGTG